MSESSRTEICECGATLSRIYFPSRINGGNDGFRNTMKKPFIHKREDGSKVQVENWKQWEREGYRSVEDSSPMYASGNRVFMDVYKEKTKRCKSGDTESGVRPQDL
jgi:hypothetical protein